MNEGDIYFWRYRDDVQSPYDLYHCKSRKAVVVGGRLVDTFWSSPSDGHVVDPSRVILDFKGNQSDLRKIREWEVPYYDEDAVIDMRHSNDRRADIYVKADAKRSRDAMLRHIASAIEDKESDIRCAQHRIAALSEAKAAIEAGNLDTVAV